VNPRDLFQHEAEPLNGQTASILLYVLGGLALSSTPIFYSVFFAGTGTQGYPSPALKKLQRLKFVGLAGFLAIVAGLTWWFDRLPYLIGAVVVAAALAAARSTNRMLALTTSLAAVGASGTLLWWMREPAGVLVVPTHLLVLFLVIILLISLGVYLPVRRGRGITVVLLAVLGIFALQYSLDFSVLKSDQMYQSVRHHWGAYIGPSETVLSGARILYDIPAQYGLGPTMLIASAPGDDRWIGMYWTVIATGLLYSFFLLASACLIARKIDNTWSYLTIVLASIASSLCWTSFPPALGGAWSFPSTGGLRFMPLAALVFCIVWTQSRTTRTVVPLICGHALWCLAAIWSPEAAFYSSFVWWPYLLWLASTSGKRPIRDVISAILEIVSVALVFLVTFVSIYYSMYGVMPDPDAYTAYVVNLTGPLPIDPKGAIWFFGFTVISGLVAAALVIRNKTDEASFAIIFVCLLSLYATFSYYLGRSHDNNILNLMPFLVLVLAAVRAFSRSATLSRTAHVALASVLALTPLFGWSARQQASGSDYSAIADISSMSYIRGDTSDLTGIGAVRGLDNRHAMRTPTLLDFGDPGDAARAVFYASVVRHEPLIKLENAAKIAPIGPRAWAAIHDPIDFYFLPDALVARFIDRTMKNIKSPGWLVIAKSVDGDSQTLRWQRLLAESYVATEEIDFNSYHAIRYAPKLAGGPAH
jgi:hypothetical protein